MRHLNLEFEFVSYGFEYVYLVTLFLRRQHFVLEDFVALEFFPITFESSFILVSRQQNFFELKKVFSFLEDVS